jgi:hypothetical protein
MKKDEGFFVAAFAAASRARVGGLALLLLPSHSIALYHLLRRGFMRGCKGKGRLLTLVVGKEAAFAASGIVLGGFFWWLTPCACRDCAGVEWLWVSERWLV